MERHQHVEQDQEERTPLLPQSAKSCCGRNEPLNDRGESTCCSRGTCCSQSITDEDDCFLTTQPWQYKAVALICALLLAVGSHFAAHTLGAMKNTIKQEFGISNSQYGALQSSVSIVNTVLPIIGGIFLDSFGTSTGSVVTTLLITSGNILVALSTHNASLSTMVVGRILYGIGSGTVVIVQETILSQWFKGRSLAAVIALLLTVSRLASFSAQATVIPIANWMGWWGYGFWFSALLCVFSFVMNLIYLALMRTIKMDGGCQRQMELMRRKKSFKWSKLLYLPHSFWLVAAMEFLLGGSWGCFLHINSEYVKLRFGYSNAHAAATASVAQIMPVILMPFLGLCVDRYGKRTWMMIGSGLAMLAPMILLEYTQLTPVIGMILFSVSLALGPVGLVSSVPVILPLSLVGTGMGIIKSGTNVGATLFDISVGLLQDATPNKGYSLVIVFFIVIASLAIVAGITLCILDRTMYHSLLDRSRQEAAKDTLSDSKASEMRENKANYFYGGLFATLCVTSWVLFGIFVLF